MTSEITDTKNVCKPIGIVGDDVRSLQFPRKNVANHKIRDSFRRLLQSIGTRRGMGESHENTDNGRQGFGQPQCRTPARRRRPKTIAFFEMP